MAKKPAGITAVADQSLSVTQSAAAAVTHLRLRVREGLLDQLEQESKKSNRTLTGEIIYRLERSFEKESRVSDLLGGPETAAVLRILAGEIDLLKHDSSNYDEVDGRFVPKKAPDQIMKAWRVTARACARLASHMLPECKWAGVAMGMGPQKGPWVIAPTLLATKLLKSDVKEG
jgi:hypothetical protein